MWDKINAFFFDPICNTEIFVTFTVRHGASADRIWQQAKKEMYSAYEVPHVDCWRYVAQGVDI